MVNGLTDYEYQNDCVEYLFDKTTSADSKKIITVKAPTGAGKTVILIKYVNFYLNNTGDKVAFIWLWKSRAVRKWKNLCRQLTQEICHTPCFLDLTAEA